MPRLHRRQYHCPMQIGAREWVGVESRERAKRTLSCPFRRMPFPSSSASLRASWPVRAGGGAQQTQGSFFSWNVDPRKWNAKLLGGCCLLAGPCAFEPAEERRQERWG